MNCQDCRDLLNHLLVVTPGESEAAVLTAHLESCPACAREDAEARRALAVLSAARGASTASRLKECIATALAESEATRSAPAVVGARRFGWRIAAAVAAAVVVLCVLARRHFQEGDLSGPSLLARACAAEENQFAGDKLVHMTSEIVVVPIDDKELVPWRWLPLLSLEASGKPHFNQLALPSEVGQGYTVRDEAWYDGATGRFARVLSSEGKPIFANAFDGKNVYALETPEAGPAKIVGHPIDKDFERPKSPADFLGFAATLRTGLDKKDEDLVTVVGKTTLDDGTEARTVKLQFPAFEANNARAGYFLMTIRSIDNVPVKAEWFVGDKPILLVRHLAPTPGGQPEMGWDLAGLAKLLPGNAAAAMPVARPDMVILDVTVEQIVERADFTPYMLSKNPAWAQERQLADILDVASPPHRMFIAAYRANDGRHVVLVQSFTVNGNGPSVKETCQVLYTSPGGVKVWSGPTDDALAKLLLLSATYFVKDAPGKELTGYFLETPEGTFPALAINGKLSDDELHGLVDSLVPAK
jgi:hypothetical protein